MIEIKTVDDSFGVAKAPPTRTDLGEAADNGYRSVVNLRCAGEEDQPLTPDQEGEAAAALGLEYRHLPVAGDAISKTLVDEFRASVEAMPKPVLVHCASGKRAGAFTMMHLAAQQGLSGEAALAQAAQMGIDCGDPALEKFVRNYVDGAQP